MKQKVYFRFGKNKKGTVTVKASTRLCHEAVKSGTGCYERVLPTISFAVNFDIPDELFEQAERVCANIELDAENTKIVAPLASIAEEVGD